MKCHFKTYVVENVPNASQEDVSLFPSNRTISRQIYKVMMRLHHSKIDEVKVLKMIDLWKQDVLADFIYFWPKMSSSDIEYANTEDGNDILYHVPRGNEDVKNNLLFIHMTVAQKLLLQCYNNLVLMDATYHTYRLMLPLFFLAMRTNVNYSPIASFIVQNEDAKSISKALSRIKQYIILDRIDIKNFMIDCSQNYVSQHYELMISTFKIMGGSSSVSEYKRHKEYLKRHTVYKKSRKLWEYFQRWERNKKVCITLIIHWPCSIRTEPFKITLAVIMYHALYQ